MQKTLSNTGATFAVDDVKPATQLLPECRMHQSLASLLGGIESCHDYHGTTVKGIYYQPLLAAVYTAFSQHRPLVLTPDAVWITIAQGVAHHMVIRGERLRSKFVSHQGKLDLTFVAHDWVEGSPENPWAEAFDSWAGQIRDHVGPEIHDTLVCDFSTSGPTDRAVSQIVMMDIFERYFHYVLYGICGIPTITLEGTTDDWEHLQEKVDRLRIFEIDWWLDHLHPICDQFIRASRGDVDLSHWQNICKLRSEYGGDIVNGWIAKLFPYLRGFSNGPCNRKNPIFETGQGFQTLDAPPGLSRVPFTWRNAPTRRERMMEAIGGLIGVTQDPDTLALRPKVGWAVREAEKMDFLLARLAKNHKTFPGANQQRDLDDRILRAELPLDLSKFYHRTNGAGFCGGDAVRNLRIVPREEIQHLDWGENQSPDLVGSYGPNGRIWHRIAWLQDGSWLAINLDCNKHLAPWWKDLELREKEKTLGFELFAPICHGSAATQNKSGQNPVIALSFTELLERSLDSGGQPYWHNPEFVDYGDAEIFTRRK